MDGSQRYSRFGLGSLTAILAATALIFSAPGTFAADSTTTDSAVAADSVAPAASDATPAPDAPAQDPPAAAPTEAPVASPTPSADAADPAPADSPSPSPSASPTTATPTPTASPTTAPKSLKSLAATQAATGDVTVLSVPAPDPGKAVITIKKGGIRTGATTVGVLAGAQFTIYSDGATAPGATVIGTCTSDANGDCSVQVPGGGARYWIVETAAPAGWFKTDQFDTSASSSTDQMYRVRTDAITAGQTYSFPVASNSTSSPYRAQGSVWSDSLNNPSFPNKCGIRVGLLIDLSASLQSSQSALRTAASGFVTALSGTPSSVGVWTFSGTAPAIGSNNANIPLTSVAAAANVTALNNKINALTVVNDGTKNQATNWDQGLWQVAQASAADQVDVLLVLTDGNPTVYGPSLDGPGDNTRFRELENAIFSANAVKALGTKVVAVGVGSGVTGSTNNLESISGPTLNTDYFQSANYTALGTLLKNLALSQCASTVNVVKMVIPPGGTTANAVLASGWTFGATGTGVSPSSGATNATGAVSFKVDGIPVGGTQAVNITETQQSGYTLVPQGAGAAARNAVCKDETGAAQTVTNNGALGFTVNALQAKIVSCTVYNQAPNPQASIKVNKNWVINGTAYANGSQPFGTANLTLAGAAKNFGQEYTGYTQGNTVAIAETTTNLPPYCSAPVVSGDVGTKTLGAGLNTYQITNTVTCTTQLKLIKVVQGGNAAANLWTLNALPMQNDTTPITNPAVALQYTPGTTGVTGAVTPGVVYELAESGGDPRYAQEDVRNPAQPRPRSTGSWHCFTTDANGNRTGEYDGLNGGVVVGLGQHVECEARNRTATLSILKNVVNQYGLTAAPSAFSLTATPTGTVPAGLNPATVTGGTTVVAGNTINVRPGQSYALTESTVNGYTQQSLSCTSDIGAGPVNYPLNGDGTVSVAALGNVVCTFVNHDVPAKLTLVKSVSNGSTGGTAAATAWTLKATASGAPTPALTGVSGAAGVTAVTVNPNVAYTLAETGGPAGYTQTGLACVLTGTQNVVAAPAGVVTPTPGQDVTCTFTNTAQQAKLTLVKNVAGPNPDPASSWTLTATGPTAGVTGVTGAAAVTAANVAVGTYALSESGPTIGYDASLWTCTAGGQPVTVTGGSVPIALGQNVTCQITNTAKTTHLVVNKIVTNTHGGTAVASNFTVTASGPTPLSGAGTVSGNVQLGLYTIGETGGPAGYVLDSVTCFKTGSSPRVGVGVDASHKLTLARGDDVTCEVVNVDQGSTLTLTKIVDKGAAGNNVALPSQWSLSATGPTNISGLSGSADVTSKPVNAGQYTLAETGPIGYTPASTWVCTGGTVTGNTLTVPLNANVSCAITNTAIAPKLTLTKVVTNTHGGTATPANFTLTATGPSTITGHSADAAVTNAPVQAGTYTLSEGAVTGYQLSSLTCVVNGGAPTTPSNNQLALVPGDVASCTFTNVDKAPKLTLVKTVNNGNTGGTAVATDWTLTATGSGAPTLTGVSGAPAVTAQVVKANLAYALAETGGPSGYSQTGLACVLTGTQTSVPVSNGNVTLALDTDVTCTFTNTANASHLTLIKNSLGAFPDPATTWTLAAAGPTPISGVTGNAAVTVAPVLPGTYTLSETGPTTGYLASQWSCAVGTEPAQLTGGSIVVPLGKDVVCQITNTAQPTNLHLIKTVTNTHGGTAVSTDFTVKADGPSHLSGAGTATGLVQAGTYALTETGLPTGYTQSNLKCYVTNSQPALDVPVTNGNVTLVRGAQVTCEFVNVDNPATLTLIKIVDKGQAGNNVAVPSDWTLTAQGPQTITGKSGAPEVTSQTVNAGTYNLSENGPAGYTPGSWECTGAAVEGSMVAVPLAGQVICRITNTAIAPRLTLFKVVDNEHGGTETPDDFTLDADGPSHVSGETGDPEVTNVSVEAGTYDLSESTIAGYERDALICTVNGSPVDTSGDSVTLAAGDNASCEFDNSDSPAHLTLVKYIQTPNGQVTDTNGDWTLTADGPTTISGVTFDPSISNAAVDAGTYTLSENGPTKGYDRGDWVCGESKTDDGVVTLEPGDNVTCYVVNTEVQPKLTLVKEVTNDNGGTAVPTDWTLTATGPTTISGATGDDSVTHASVTPGTYTVTESNVPGYEQTSFKCTPNSPEPTTPPTSSGPTVETDAVAADNTVTLALGDDVTCVLTNDDISPKLTLVKEVQGNEETGGTATPQDWTLAASQDDSAVISGAGGVESTAVDAGTYTLSEESNNDPVTMGYEAQSWVCVDSNGDPVTVDDGEVTLALASNVTCTIVNIAQPTQWKVVKTSDPASGASVLPGQTINYTITVTHTGGVAATDITLTDDLTHVLDNATLQGEPDPFTASTGTVTRNDPSIDWNIPTLTDSATLNYSVVVNGGATGVLLKNTVTRSDGPCQEGDVCTTEHETPQWTIAKSSDKPQGSNVLPGQTITYTVTATNTSNVDVTGITVVDDLTDVLGAGTYNSADTSASTGSVTDNPTDITWNIPTLAANSSETLTYTVTVKAGAWGSTLRNVVIGNGEIPPEQCAGDVPESTPTPTEGPADRAAAETVGEPPCGTTHIVPKLPTLRLLKVVDNGTVTRIAQPNDWSVNATPKAIEGQGLLTGNGLFNSASVLPGTYDLSELPISQVAQTGFKNGTWACNAISAAVPVQDPTTGNWPLPLSGTPLTVTDGAVTLDFGQNVECHVVNVAYTVNLAIAKTSRAIGSDTPGGVILDEGAAGQQFDYDLTVSNIGADPATGVTETDNIPASLTVDPSTIVAPAGWTAVLSDTAADGSGGKITATFAGSFAPEATATITFRVSVIETIDANVVNTACVTETEQDSDTADNCATDTVTTKTINPNASVVCNADSPFLDLNVTTTNVPNASSLPITVTWYDLNGNVAQVDTLPAGTTTAHITWPGATLNADGIAIGFPGYRPAREGETPTYEGLLLDPTLPSYLYRFPMTVKISINPSETVTVQYPPASPVCVLPRDPHVQITKTASVTQAKPGDSFNYSLSVANLDLGAAFPLTVTDQIPAQLKVNSITTDQNVFPRFADCAVTDKDANGYGGKLTCNLNGALRYQETAPLITLNVTLGSLVPGGTLWNTGQVCYQHSDDPSLGIACDQNAVSIKVAGQTNTLPRTGTDIAGLGVLGIGMAIAGGFLLTRLNRRLRRIEL